MAFLYTSAPAALDVYCDVQFQGASIVDAVDLVIGDAPGVKARSQIDGFFLSAQKVFF